MTSFLVLGSSGKTLQKPSEDQCLGSVVEGRLLCWVGPIIRQVALLLGGFQCVIDMMIVYISIDYYIMFAASLVTTKPNFGCF